MRSKFSQHRRTWSASGSCEASPIRKRRTHRTQCGATFSRTNRPLRRNSPYCCKVAKKPHPDAWPPLDHQSPQSARQVYVPAGSCCTAESYLVDTAVSRQSRHPWPCLASTAGDIVSGNWRQPHKHGIPWSWRWRQSTGSDTDESSKRMYRCHLTEVPNTIRMVTNRTTSATALGRAACRSGRLALSTYTTLCLR